MTFTVRLSHNIPDVQRVLTEAMQKQVPYAGMRTVNNVAFLIKEETEKDFRQYFHKPTPWTMRAMTVLKAEKGSPTAWVGLKQQDIRNVKAKGQVFDSYYELTLTQQFGGGLRKHKPFENALIRKGIMPPNMYAIPTSFCPMDGYDNPRVGVMIQIMAYFDTFREVGYKKNMGKAGRAKHNKRLAGKMSNYGTQAEYIYSWGPHNLKATAQGGSGARRNELPAGIWKKFTNMGLGGTTIVQPMFLFTPIKSYMRRISLPAIVQYRVAPKAKEMFAQELAKALANDRGLQRFLRR